MANAFRKGPTSPYRAMDRRVHERRRSLSLDGRIALDELWWGAHSSSCGCINVPLAYLLHDLGWRRPRLERALLELEKAGWILRDGSIITIPDLMACNPPQSENVITAWLKWVTALPDSPIFAETYRRASEFITDRGLAWLKPKVPSLQAHENAEPRPEGLPKPCPSPPEGFVPSIENKKGEEKRAKSRRGAVGEETNGNGNGNGYLDHDRLERIVRHLNVPPDQRPSAIAVVKSAFAATDEEVKEALQLATNASSLPGTLGKIPQRAGEPGCEIRPPRKGP